MKNTEKIYALFRQHAGVATDTRKELEDRLFFALSGENFNGNRFAEAALEKGAAAVIVDDPGVARKNDTRYILVDDALQSLQNLARYHRQKFAVPVLAITGTNGKTTTKELCAAVLSSGKKICYTQGNFNNHIGVPLTLLQIEENTETAIVEMGANHPGEIDKLCRIALPTHGLITNIGKAHLEGFGNFQGVVNTKNELYRFLRNRKGTVFVHKDDALLMQLSEDLSRVTYGLPPADYSGELLSANPLVSVAWQQPQKTHLVKTNLYGRYNFPNIMAAVAVGSFFGITAAAIAAALAGYRPENNRSQILSTAHNTLILDAYNANPESMTLAIDNFAAQQFPHTVLILGDMFELGDASREEHQKIVDKLQSLSFQKVILVGKAFSETCSTDSFQRFATTGEAARYLKENPVRQAHILVKGSRGMALEKIIQYL
jgi:UDP-N-acetylmuramoyl-tripeptide--D-alanyl-D-alanine ligase